MEDGETISRLGLKSIKCILCHQVSRCTLLTPPPQVILLAELPPTQYITHLMSAHEVLFDLEFLVQRTLQQQHPELAKSAAGCCIDKTGKSPTECEPSWSLGCLYRCAICSVKFQTLTSFQSHLFFHRTTPEQYLAQHGESVTTLTSL